MTPSSAIRFERFIAAPAEAFRAFTPPIALHDVRRVAMPG